MDESWINLLFAHGAVALRPAVPAGIPIDTFQGNAKSLLHYAARQDALVWPLRSPTPRQDDERGVSRDGDTRSGAESGRLH